MGHDASCCVTSGVTPTLKVEALSTTDPYSCLTLPSFLDSSSPSSESSTSSSTSSEAFPSVGLANEASTLHERSGVGETASAALTSSSKYELSSGHVDRSGLSSSLNIPSPILEEDLAISMHELDDVDGISEDFDLDMKPRLDEMYLSDGCCRADSGCDEDMFMSRLDRLDELLQSGNPQEVVCDSGLASMSDLFPDLSTPQEFSVLDDMSAWAAVDNLQGLESASFPNAEDVQVTSPSSFGGEEESASQMFARWLQSNAHWISLSDLRKIKLKTSTIESVTKRLGGGKKGLMLFLKFVLMWVQNSQTNLKEEKAVPVVSPSSMHSSMLHTSGFPGTTGMAVEGVSGRDSFGASDSSGGFVGNKTHMQTSFSGCGSSPTAAMSADWTTARTQGAHTTLVHPNLSSPMSRSYTSPLQNTNFCQTNNPWLHHNSNVVRGVCPTSMSSPLQSLARGSNSRMGGGCSPDASSMLMSMQQPHCADSTPAATTRAARKSRMERQRWSVRRNRKWAAAGQHHRLATVATSNGYGHSSTTSWSQSLGSGMQKSSYSSSQMCQQSSKGTSTMEYQQSKRPERSLKLLFHKELKQSDVGSLGRIVLPKAAETCLPPLELRDGVNLVVEDMNSTKVWNMRYRFWPNNKSRMYLLENTSDFVKLYDLKEGDYMMMYLDSLSNRYVVRGAKGSGVQAAALAGSNNDAHAGDKRRRSLSKEEANLASVGGAMNSEDSCDDSLLVELIEQSLEE